MTSDGSGYSAFMPCYMAGQGLGIKINTNFRDNPSRHRLPRILGLLVLLDTETGMPLVIMDSTAITVFRTAAVSGVAMRHLAKKDAEVFGILGTGVLSLPHILAAVSVGPIRKVRAYSHGSKSVGLAFEDLIAARHVYSNAVASGSCTSFDFFDLTSSAAVN